MATPATKLEWHMDEQEWYASTLAHWTGTAIQDHDNEGVLGGWGEVDVEDAKGSLPFVAQSLNACAPIEAPIKGFRALDCGAGVGRVTESVLLHVAEQVHLVEVSDRLLRQAATKVCWSFFTPSRTAIVAVGRRPLAKACKVKRPCVVTSFTR
jgi:hypothetical protein